MPTKNGSIGFFELEETAGMELIQFHRHYGKQLFVRMIMLSCVLTAIIFWKMEFIADVYFRNQLTTTGLIINGSIISLFCAGIIKLLLLLVKYIKEENAIVLFIKNFDEKSENPLAAISATTLIAQRYHIVKHLYDRRTPVNHGALASAMVATESTVISFPKFINNTLILTGVFGTIISLSIALLGASKLLESSINIGGMGMVIHGMSTALSTTITAIVCYLFFGYFYLKLTDIQTNVISAIEQITANILLPEFQVKPDSVLYEFSGLVRSLQGLVNTMQGSQESFNAIEQRLITTIGDYHGSVLSFSEDLKNIKAILQAGFRLPEDK